ncbi:hypothetical protein [Streptomyces sp. NPDC058664]|uniref:hypothetical protein n=1 Tax=unclassified Streptomyces TaxID=2593676 RepID=UPI00364EAF53
MSGDFDFSVWLTDTMRLAQEQAIERAQADGAYGLRQLETRVEPDGAGGITIRYEWEMAVLRDE